MSLGFEYTAQEHAVEYTAQDMHRSVHTGKREVHAVALLKKKRKRDFLLKACLCCNP